MSRCERLIALLDNPQEEFWAESQLISQGEKCIESLRAFLSTTPRAQYRPWIKAVDILIQIDKVGNKAFLEELLLRPWNTPDDTPERLGEETFKDHIAFSLGSENPEEVQKTLLVAIQRFRSVGAALALARQREPEAIPFLLDMLEDDVRRERAARALIFYGDQALPHLSASLDTLTRLEGGGETPGSLLRRKKILEILGDLPGEGGLIILIDVFLSSDLDLEAAIILAQRGYPQRQLDRPVVGRLMQGLCSGDWYVSLQCKEALMSMEGIMDVIIEKLKTEERPPFCVREAVRLLAKKNPRLAEDKLSAVLLGKKEPASETFLQAIIDCQEFSPAFKEIVRGFLDQLRD